MPIHDWTRLEAGDFHDFHQGWVVGICDALNCGLLPPDYMALSQRESVRPIPDPIALTSAPSSVREIAKIERMIYARRADRVEIRHGRGKVVAIIEILSPGNKDSRNAIRSFVEKAANVLNQGVNLLVVDLFPPSPRDPFGIHKAIWDEFSDEPFEVPPGKPLVVASYLGGDGATAYVESVGVGDPLPSLPIFLSETRYIPAPLEATYQQAWDGYPAMLKELFETSAG